MIVLPTAYLGPLSWYRLLMQEGALVEQMESFEKQTYRNRCLIRGTKGEKICLTVPVGRVEHKQLTRDIHISYQTKWQHQHWMALRSAYERTPYFLYYEDYLRPMYEKRVEYLLDWNEELAQIVVGLMHNNPALRIPMVRTEDWQGQVWTDQHLWQREWSVVDSLFEYGPELIGDASLMMNE